MLILNGALTKIRPPPFPYWLALAVYAECSNCFATDDRMTLMECRQCHSLTHVSCLRQALPDTELFDDPVRAALPLVEMLAFPPRTKQQN